MNEQSTPIDENKNTNVDEGSANVLNQENQEATTQTTPENEPIKNEGPNDQNTNLDTPSEKANEQNTPPNISKNQSTKPKKAESLTIRADVDDKKDFKELCQSFPTQLDAFKKLMDLHRNPVKAETKIIEKPIFKNVEVEKKLSENQFIVELSPKQMELFELIKQARFDRAKKKGTATEMETNSELFIKSFFNKSRLQNIDGEFYTGF
jgi:hypothetical protein